MLDGIRAACGDARPCQLRPLQLFLAWNGVLVLVYEGFPDSLAGIKGRLAPRYGRENFGSRWPKTTLAATSDTAPELALPELERLRTLCVAHSAGLPSEPVPVKGVEVVEYKWRSLEAEGAPQRAAIPLPGGGGANGGSSGSSVGEEERERVRSVLSEWDDTAAYLPLANKVGSRISSYRHASPAGATLVTFLATSGGDQWASVLRQLRAFRESVDGAFPGRFAWMAEESLHCTLRALDTPASPDYDPRVGGWDTNKPTDSERLQRTS